MYSPCYDLHIFQLKIIETKVCFKACLKTCTLLGYCRDKNLFFNYFAMWKSSLTALYLLIANIYGLEYNHQLRLQLFCCEQLYMGIRAQMLYLKARSLEPVEERFFGWEIHRDAVSWNQSGIQAEGVFQMRRHIS